MCGVRAQPPAGDGWHVRLLSRPACHPGLQLLALAGGARAPDFVSLFYLCCRASPRDCTLVCSLTWGRRQISGSYDHMGLFGGFQGPYACPSGRGFMKMYELTHPRLEGRRNLTLPPPPVTLFTHTITPCPSTRQTTILDGNNQKTSRKETDSPWGQRHCSSSAHSSNRTHAPVVSGGGVVVVWWWCAGGVLVAVEGTRTARWVPPGTYPLLVKYSPPLLHIRCHPPPPPPPPACS